MNKLTITYNFFTRDALYLALLNEKYLVYLSDYKLVTDALIEARNKLKVARMGCGCKYLQGYLDISIQDLKIKTNQIYAISRSNEKVKNYSYILAEKFHSIVEQNILQGGFGHVEVVEDSPIDEAVFIIEGEFTRQQLDLIQEELSKILQLDVDLTFEIKKQDY